LTRAIVDYIQTTLGYKIDEPYHLLSYEVNGKWDWNVSSHGGEPETPSSVDDLREALALDPKLKVLIAHGMTDTITPFFATQYIIDHVPEFGDASRLQLKVYPGGHMNYTRDGSRAMLRADAMKLYPGG
jgi:carboxypeptidase C (cathepsin A)